jgi:hypothetical protein
LFKFESVQNRICSNSNLFKFKLGSNSNLFKKNCLVFFERKMKNKKVEKPEENHPKSQKTKKPKNLRKPKSETRKLGKTKKIIIKRLMGRPALENIEGRGCA